MGKKKTYCDHCDPANRLADLWHQLLMAQNEGNITYATELSAKIKTQLTKTGETTRKQKVINGHNKTDPHLGAGISQK